MNEVALPLVLGGSAITVGVAALVVTLRPLIAYELADLRAALSGGC